MEKLIKQITTFTLQLLKGSTLFVHNRDGRLAQVVSSVIRGCSYGLHHPFKSAIYALFLCSILRLLLPFVNVVLSSKWAGYRHCFFEENSPTAFPVNNTPHAQLSKTVAMPQFLR